MKRTTAISNLPNRTALMFAAFAIFCAAGFWVAIVSGLTDGNSLVWTDRDFSNYWIASRLVLEGVPRDLFGGHEVYFGHMTRAFGVDYPWHSWSYPPHFLLLIWPLGLLPQNSAMILFLLVTFLIYLHAVSLSARSHSEFPWLFLLPFTVCNVLAAQNGFLTAALMLYGLGLRDRLPLVAGISIGILTIKPQLGILLPILLLYERRWLVIGSAAVTTVVMVLMSVWAFGYEVWIGYVQQTWPYQTRVANEGQGDFLAMLLSAFGSIRSLGYDAQLSILVHAPVAIAAFCFFIWTLTRLKQPEDRAASLVFATFLISPYSLVYDLGALVVVGGSLYREGSENLGRRTVYMLVASIPLLYRIIALAGAPIIPLILAAGWAALVSAGNSPNRTAY